MPSPRRSLARALVLTAAVAAALLIPVPPLSIRNASAHALETETRLKAAGVPDALRPKIHDAIDRGVVWLARQQRADGRLADGHVGTSVLAALALRHAGTPVAKAALEKSLVWLLPKDGRISPSLYDDVYTAGIATMLLEPDADARRQGIAKDIARRIPGGIDPSYGLWWYSTLGKEGPTAPLVRSGGPNLSTSQFACLGIWAGSRLGVSQPRATWRIHLDRLEHMVKSTGGFCYRDHTSSTEDRRPYWTATFMGHADLTLGRAALADAWTAEDPLRPRVEKLAKAADDLLERDAGILLRAIRAHDEGIGDGENMFRNGWSYYGLYALEKACVFAGIEKIGDARWYVDGAEHLLRVQSDDGGWGWPMRAPATRRADALPAGRSSNVVDTAFALLFLARSSEHYRPTTPRDVDAPPPPVVTPNDSTSGRK